jgi:hypothetical protein
MAYVGYPVAFKKDNGKFLPNYNEQCSEEAEMYQLAGGSIPGTEHTQRGDILCGKNNHDAFGIYQTPELSIALVADGCGGQPHSEVGSKLGVGVLTAALESAMRNALSNQEIDFTTRLNNALKSASKEVLELFSIVAKAMLQTVGNGGERLSFSQIVSDYFLSTFIGVVVSQEDIGFFGLGDGYIAVNGEVRQLGPFHNNEPPYLAYQLLRTRWKEEELQIKILEIQKVSEVDHFLIGSDGVAELAAKESILLPGSSQVIGPISQFWSRDEYFTKAGIRKRLTLINSRRINRNAIPYVEDGRLSDDTTFIVGRRLMHKEPH